MYHHYKQITAPSTLYVPTPHSAIKELRYDWRYDSNNGDHNTDIDSMLLTTAASKGLKAEETDKAYLYVMSLHVACCVSEKTVHDKPLWIDAVNQRIRCLEIQMTNNNNHYNLYLHCELTLSHGFNNVFLQSVLSGGYFKHKQS